MAGENITDADREGIKNYQNALKEGVPTGQAWMQTMTNCSAAAKRQVGACRNNMAALTNLTTAQQTNSVAMKAGTLAVKGFSMAANAAASFGISIAITALVEGISYLINSNDRYLESQQEIIDKSNENIDKYNTEISSLESLQDKLEDAKGSKEKMASLQGDLNKAIGKTPGLINGEGKAYDAAVIKLNAQIDAKKKLLALEQKNKSEAANNIVESYNFNNAGGGHEIQSAINLDDFKKAKKKYNLDDRATIHDVVKKANENDDDTFEHLSTDEIDAGIEEIKKQSHEVLGEYINSSNSFLGPGFLTQYMEGLASTGLNTSEIKKKLSSVISDSKIETIYDDYIKSFTPDGDDLDSSALYNQLEEYFDNFKKSAPYMEEQLDLLFSSLVKTVKTQNMNVEKTFVPFDDIVNDPRFKNTIEELTKLSKSGELSPEMLSSTSEYSKILKETGLSAEEAYNSINKHAISTSSLSETVDSIKTSDGFLKEVNDQITNNGKISLSTLQNIAKEYTTLEKYVLSYTSNVEGSQDSLIDALAQIYQNDLDTYAEYYKNKCRLDEKYWSNFASQASTEIRLSTESLGVNLSDYTSYDDAKTKINEKISNLSGSIEREKNSRYYNDYTFYSQAKINSAEKDIETYSELLKLLEKYYSDAFNWEDITSNLDLNKKPSSTPTIFDWIETKINKIQTKVSDLASTVSNTFKTFGKRSSALSSESSAISEQISVLNSAYSQYMNKANSVGLSNHYKSLVQDGSLDITPANDNDAEKINQYKEWYEKAENCKNIIKELNDEVSQLAKQKIDLISEDFENKLGSIQSKTSLLESFISLEEAKGYMVSADFYKELSNVEKQNNSFLQQERNALTSALNDAVNSGEIDKYSTEWYSLNQQIDGITQAIVESDTALQEFNNSMREVDWSIFEFLQDTISNVTEESEFLIEMLSNKKLTDDKGLTQYGDATLGLHAVNYNIYSEQAKKYADKVNEISKQLAKDPYNQTLIEKKNEYIDLQRESISASEDEKQAMIDLVKEGYDAELNSLNVLITKYKELLQSKKDENDYQKDISEQTKNINNLKKQLMAYKGNDSEEIRTTIQKLELSLKEAEDNLEETQYDKFISFQEDLFTELTTEYEEFIENKLESINDNINSLITEVNNKSTEISDTLGKVTGDLGTTLSTEMSSIWNNSTNNITNSINNVLTSIDNFITSMGKSANASANASINNAKTNNTTPKPSTPTPSTPSGSGSSFRSMFIHKKDSYSKSKLNINTSIVDRLKYYDFDSSTSARSSYWKKMGRTETYIGSDSQNIWMLNQMKKNGFAKGGVVGDLISKTGEDGFVLARKNESILTEAQGEKLLEIIDKIHVLDNIRPKIENLSKVPSYDFSQSAKSANINIEMGDISLPNVTKPEEFANDFINIVKTNSKVQKVLKGATTDLLSGKSILNINKY